MKLSIITINFNNKEGLQKTIDSVITQTFTDYEWIVIDGCSTDGSKDLIEQYAEHFSYWISEPDKGIYNAMNKGILKASGEWFQFLNSGDWLYQPDVLATVFSRSYETDILYGNIMVSKNSNIFERKYPDNISFSFFIYNNINHQSSFYKKEVIQNCLYNESYSIVSDWANYFKLILQNKTFVHLDYPIVFFDINGIGSVLSEAHKRERTDVLDYYIPFHLKPDMEKILQIKDFEDMIQKHSINQKIINIAICIIKIINRIK